MSPLEVIVERLNATASGLVGFRIRPTGSSLERYCYGTDPVDVVSRSYSIEPTILVAEAISSTTHKVFIKA